MTVTAPSINEAKPARPVWIDAAKGTTLARPQWPADDVLRDGWRQLGMSEADVEKKLAAAHKEHSEVKSLSREFEANFIALLLNSMKKTVEENELFHGGAGEETFEPMLNLEQARTIANSGRGFGIAEMVEDNLVAQYQTRSVKQRDGSYTKFRDASGPADSGLRAAGLPAAKLGGAGDRAQAGEETRPLNAPVGAMDSARNAIALHEMRMRYGK